MPTPFSISDSLGEAPSIAQSAGGVKSLIHSPWLSRPGLRPPMKITTTNLCRRFPPSQNQNALPGRAPPGKASEFSETPTIVLVVGRGLWLSRFHLYISPSKPGPLICPQICPRRPIATLTPFLSFFTPPCKSRQGVATAVATAWGDSGFFWVYSEVRHFHHKRTANRGNPCFKAGGPSGIRTRVSALRGRRPRPG